MSEIEKPEAEKPEAEAGAEKPDWLPMAYFGTAETPLPDWRAAPDDDDDDPDDELLPETPPDVVAMLGLDPRALFAEPEPKDE